MAKGYTTEALVEAESGVDITSSSTPTSTELSTWIEEVEKDIDELTETTFKTATTVTDEVFSLDRYNLFRSPQSLALLKSEGRRDSVFGASFPDMFFLRVDGVIRKPVTVSALAIQKGSDPDSDDWDALTENTGSSGNYNLDTDQALVILLDKIPRERLRGVKWSGTYGYSTLPVSVQQLATKMVAKRVLMSNILKAQTQSPDSYSIGNFSRSKGGLGNMVTLLKYLDEDIEKLRGRIVKGFVSEVV